MSEPNTDDFPLPPPPPFPVEEQKAPAGPVMSTAETLTGIFFEPGRTFEALRERPRFLVAGIIILIAFLAFTTAFYQRIGYENLIRAEVESSPRASDMSPQQKEQAIAVNMWTVVKIFRYAAPLIGVAVFIALGGALYLLGAMAMGRSISYKQAISVWTYSSLPPTVITMLLNIILLFLRSPDSYDLVQASRRGLVQANPSLLVDATAHPVLATVLGSLDLLAFYGLFLAAIGLRKVGRMSSGTAWAIVLIIWLVGVILRVAGSAFMGAM